MPKSATERQRDYKARQKAKGVDFAEVQRNWRKENKDKVRNHNQTQKLKGNHARYWKGKNGKKTARRGYEKKMSNPGQRLMLSIGSRITQFMKDPSKRPSTRLKSFTEFQNSEEVRSHFERQFQPWMNWENYGVHKLGDERAWNVGHQIPLSKYSPNDVDDFKLCWSKQNLIPQDAQENSELNDSMPPLAKLLELKAIWPLAWNGCLPSGV